MPCSSLVEIEIKIEVALEVGVEVEVQVYATLSFRHSLDGVQILFRVVGWRNGD